MSDSFSILFYPKSSDKNKKGKVPLFLRITVDGRRSELSLKRKIDPLAWNSFSGMVKGSRPQTKQLNRFLDDVQSRLLKIQGDYVKEGKYYTAQMLRNDFLGKD